MNTEAIQTMQERWATAEANASASDAFSIASGMEDDLTEIEQLIDALALIAHGEDGRAASALRGIANSLEDRLRIVEQKRQEMFHQLWSYHCGKRREHMPDDQSIAKSESEPSSRRQSWDAPINDAAVRERLRDIGNALDLPEGELKELLTGQQSGILDFAHKYGQSLDWIFTGDVIPMLCGAYRTMDHPLRRPVTGAKEEAQS
jgi:hypothetical protein